MSIAAIPRTFGILSLTACCITAHTKEEHLLLAVELYREAKEHAKAQGLSDDETTRFLEPHVDRWQHCVSELMLSATTTQRVQPNVRPLGPLGPTDDWDLLGGFKIGKWRIELQERSSEWKVKLSTVGEMHPLFSRVKSEVR